MTLLDHPGAVLPRLMPTGYEVQGASKDDLIGVGHFDAEWFFGFVETHCYDNQKHMSAPALYSFMQWQRDEWSKLFAIDSDGVLDHETIMPNWPRRHGKSQIASYYDLARCLAYANQLIVIQGNSDDQASETVFRWIVNTIKWSPAFHARALGANRYKAQFIGRTGSPYACMAPIEIEVLDGEIRFSNGSLIQVMPCSQASSYGRKISVYHNTEACVAVNEDVYHAGASSTGDAWCGVTIIDSNMGADGALVHRVTTDGLLAQTSDGLEGDPSVAVSYISYDDINDAVDRGLTPWLSQRWLRSRERQMTTSELRRNHLNKAARAGIAVFADAMIDSAISDRPEISTRLCDIVEADLSVWTSRRHYRALRKLFRGHSVRIGIGLDRSMGAAAGDRTVLAVWGVGVLDDLVGEDVIIYDEFGDEVGMGVADPRVYFPLAIVFFPGSTIGAIKRAIAKASKLYGDPSGIAFEHYQAKDLADWAEVEGYDNVQLSAMTDGAKASHVQRMCSLLAEHRCALPSRRYGAASVLNIEMTRYEEQSASGRFPKYGGKKHKVLLQTLSDATAESVRIKDDCVEASFWALAALSDTDPNDDGGMYV